MRGKLFPGWPLHTPHQVRKAAFSYVSPFLYPQLNAFCYTAVKKLLGKDQPSLSAEKFSRKLYPCCRVVKSSSRRTKRELRVLKGLSFVQTSALGCLRVFFCLSNSKKKKTLFSLKHNFLHSFNILFSGFLKDHPSQQIQGSRIQPCCCQI